MMDTNETEFPQYPPGFWRRIVLQPGSSWIGAALEDDMHRFHIRLDHDGERITAVHAKALRHPWTACPGAAPFIERELTGERLADVANRDPKEHCTHLLDIAILAAAHAGDTEATRFDMHVADRITGRTSGFLLKNGAERMRWLLEGTVIAGPERFAGFELRRLSQWKRDLPVREAEWATLLRRAIFVSGGRAFVPPPEEHAADQGPMRMGVCYNYQLPQAEHSTRTPNWRRDFSASPGEPLGDMDPEADFAALAD